MGRGHREIYFKYLPLAHKTLNLFLNIIFKDISIHGYGLNRQETAGLAAGGRQHQHLSTGGKVAHLINRLEEQGIIQKRVAVLDREALGMSVVVFATVNLTQIGRQNLIEFEQMIKGHPEVLECYTMTGIWDYVLKIVTRDVRHYEDFVRNTLSASDLIRELHSHVAVTEIKNTSALPLAAQGA